jgi:hypothetical protein
VVACRIGEYCYRVQPTWLPFEAREGDVDEQGVRYRYIGRYRVINRLVRVECIVHGFVGSECVVHGYVGCVIHRKRACVECLKFLHFFRCEGAVPDADVVEGACMGTIDIVLIEWMSANCYESILWNN